MTALSSSPLRPFGWYRRVRRRRPARPASITALVAQVIAAVNERGLCAASMARLAELPGDEVAAMAGQCGCHDCFRCRAN